MLIFDYKFQKSKHNEFCPGNLEIKTLNGTIMTILRASFASKRVKATPKVNFNVWKYIDLNHYQTHIVGLN